MPIHDVDDYLQQLWAVRGHCSQWSPDKRHMHNAFVTCQDIPGVSVLTYIEGEATVEIHMLLSLLCSWDSILCICR